MTVRWAILLTIMATTIACMGCASPLPHYKWVNNADAMKTMNERADRIKTISASGRLSLHRSDSADIQLDCAMVYHSPGQFRLRAWKFSQAMVDFTINDDGVWVFAPDRKQRGESTRSELGLPDSLSADHMAMTWSLVVSGFSQTLWAPCASSQQDTFAICGKKNTESSGIVCEIDRVTLTTQSCSAHNGEGNELFRLTLWRYRPFGDVVFPTRIRATNHGNAFTWLLDDIELNQPLAPRAFVPPRRAVKQP